MAELASHQIVACMINRYNQQSLILLYKVPQRVIVKDDEQRNMKTPLMMAHGKS